MGAYFGQTFRVPWALVAVEVAVVGLHPTSQRMDFVAAHALAELSRRQRATNGPRWRQVICWERFPNSKSLQIRWLTGSIPTAPKPSWVECAPTPIVMLVV